MVTPLYSGLITIIWLLSLAEIVTGVFLFLTNLDNIPGKWSGGVMILLGLNFTSIATALELNPLINTYFASLILLITTSLVSVALALFTLLVFYPQKSKMLAWIVSGLRILIFLWPVLAIFSFFILNYNADRIPSSNLVTIFQFQGVSILGEWQPIFWTISAIILIGNIFLLLRVGTSGFRKEGGGWNIPALLIAPNLIWLCLYFVPASLAPVFSYIYTIANLLLVIAYGYAQFALEKIYQPVRHNSLHRRTTVPVLAVVLVTLLSVLYFIAQESSAIFQNLESDNLKEITSTVSAEIEARLSNQGQLPDKLITDKNISATNLSQIVQQYNLPSGISTLSIYSRDGNLLVSNQANPVENVNQENWFKTTLSGSITRNEVIYDNNLPRLLNTSLISDQSGENRAVLVYQTSLENLLQPVKVSISKGMGFFYLVDQNNRIISTPDSTVGVISQDIGIYPTILKLGQGYQGFYQFTDQDRVKWDAYIYKLSNGWGLTHQIPHAFMMVPSRQIQLQIVWVFIFCILLFSSLIWLLNHQNYQQFKSLVTNSREIAAGELTKVIPVESRDELGQLGESINNITTQLRELTATLDKKIADNTRELERRVLQLTHIAEIANEISVLHDTNTLMERSVQLISDRLGINFAGLFLIEEDSNFVELLAVSSDVSGKLYPESTKIQIGDKHIVGEVASTGKPKLILENKTRLEYLNYEPSPIRSQLTLPLRMPDGVIGVLDLQSSRSSAFSEQDVSIYQILADQIASAVTNARTITTNQVTQNELRSLFTKNTLEEWEKQTKARILAYQYDDRGTMQIDGPIEVTSIPEDPSTIMAKIKYHDLTLGNLILSRAEGQSPWCQEEIEILQMLAKQIGFALEKHRLNTSAWINTRKEEHINQLCSQLHTTLDVDTLLRGAAIGISQTMDAAEVQIRFNQPDRGEA